MTFIMNPEKFSQPPDSPDNSQKDESAKEENLGSQEVEHNYEIFKNPEERNFLLDVADNFIEQIRITENPYDSFVFFDRGARLFGHLIRERWEHRFPEDKIPDTYFVKIGREMGHPSPDPYQPTYYEYPWENIFERNWDDNKLPSVEQIINRFKDNIRFKNLVKNLRESFSSKGKAIFDGKKVLLVDEFMASGATLSYGKELFSRAFESPVIDGAALVSRATVDEDSPKLKDPRFPSVIRPIPGARIPTTLGDRSYAGIKVPTPPSKEYRDKLFIKPKYLTPLEERIEVVEEGIELTEEKVAEIPEGKRVKSKERSWGVEFIAHPLLDELNDLKDELKKTREEHDQVKKKIDRYRQARNEIHSIATLD